MADAPNVIIATDCGSTTTKAILIERTRNGWRLIARGEAPTTVEAPFDDVTVGVLNAVSELEDLTGRRFLDNGHIRLPSGPSGGADLYLSTSSAGGGLQMLVTGVVKTMTAESAQRAALGAGAIVIDVLSVDDGRALHERIERIRSLRPDMVLMSGGTEGGTTSHLLDMAETLRAAAPRPRLGRDFRLPVIYAGNSAARDGVGEVLADKVALSFVENLRPLLEEENLGPAREGIHDLFLEHVMAQAPGYDKLLRWTSAPIMPTPMAVGEMVQAAARAQDSNVIAVDIGGATTDIFSVFNGAFNRTVSANLGLSYSISNVLAEAGAANILRWLPFGLSEEKLRDRLRNKMIRPTTIPQTLEELYLEQAVAREALRLAFAHHAVLAAGLKGVQQMRTIAEIFTQTRRESLIDMMNLNLIIGSGGVLSHAPLREQAALMMIDAFQPEGITRLAVDSIFMMPQLGVLASAQPEAAREVFERDCLIWLGTVVAPVGSARQGEPVMRCSLQSESAGQISPELKFGELRRIPLKVGETARLRIEPSRRFNVGPGPGRALETEIHGGVAGLILDARGRPLSLPSENEQRYRLLSQWMTELGFPSVEGSEF
jgi:uncharacterized protein (TIGR01319 family)